MKAPYDATVRFMLASLERNLLPDGVIRRLTRLLLASRLCSGYRSSTELQLSHLLQFAHCAYISWMITFLFSFSFFVTYPTGLSFDFIQY